MAGLFDDQALAALFGGQGQQGGLLGGDQLAPMQRNPAMPADWAQNAVRGLGGGILNILMAPRRAMDHGMTTGDAIPWGAQTAMGMMGMGAPMAEAGALGMAGGKLKQPAYETFSAIDAALEKALKGSKFNAIDLALNESRVKEVSPAAQALWAQRQALNKKDDMLREQLQQKLEGTGIHPMDVFINANERAKMPASAKKIFDQIEALNAE